MQINFVFGVFPIEISGSRATLCNAVCLLGLVCLGGLPTALTATPLARRPVESACALDRSRAQDAAFIILWDWVVYYFYLFLYWKSRWRDQRRPSALLLLWKPEWPLVVYNENTIEFQRKYISNTIWKYLFNFMCKNIKFYKIDEYYWLGKF